MRLTWKTVDEWREEANIEKAELARMTGISERNIHTGVRHDRRLQGGSKTAIRQVFPEKFDSNGEVKQ